MNKDTLKNTQIDPLNAGIGLRAPHYNEVLTELPNIGFLEIHSENFFAKGGAVLRTLKRAAETYPLSFHGVSLSLGSYAEPDAEHLKQLKHLVDTYNPALVSEHVAWNITDNTYLNDLLPIPYTEEALDILCRNINIMQNYLGRKILIENPSAYLSYKVPNMMPEGAFLTKAVERTSCGLLLDVNNVYVSSMNMGHDALEHLMSMPLHAVKEVHLAGHTVKTTEKGTIRIDTHNDIVCNEVWELYEALLKHTSAVPTLIEWDSDLPALNELLNETKIANTYLAKTAGDTPDVA